MLLAIWAVLAGFEVGVIYGIRRLDPSSKSTKHAVQFFGIFSSVIISLALLPQYLEIYRHKQVIGISILFMIIDMMGGRFSNTYFPLYWLIDC
jgi:hypothetical protein